MTADETWGQPRSTDISLIPGYTVLKTPVKISMLLSTCSCICLKNMTVALHMLLDYTGLRCPCCYGLVIKLWDPMDCSPPGSSIHGISQARILEWVAISSSRGIFPIQRLNPHFLLGRWILYHWVIWEAPKVSLPRAVYMDIYQWYLFHFSFYASELTFWHTVLIYDYMCY